MHDPVVLFLIDEPTAGVEPRVAALIYELIQGLAAQGKAVLLVDQNIKRALEIADYVYVMRTGTVLSEGSRDGVRRRHRGARGALALRERERVAVQRP